MDQRAVQTSDTPLPGRAMMPPHLVRHDFLDAETVAGLLDYALSHEALFQPTRMVSGKVRPEYRISMGTNELGRFRPLLTQKLTDLTPQFIETLRVTPFAPDLIELELVAHGDGAFFKQHIDTRTTGSTRTQRMLSGVYYFHAMPKAFTGGALKLCAIGENAPSVDIMPEHNSLLVFPSWAPHEVMPVSCPSGRFVDSRFAINCWIRRNRPEKT